MNRPSLRDAIDAMCKNCIYDPGSGNGTWREQVQACSSANCPLHTVRPMTVKGQLNGANAREVAPATTATLTPETALVAERLGHDGPTAAQRRAA